MRVRAARPQSRQAQSGDRFKFDSELPTSASSAIDRLTPTTGGQFPQQRITTPQSEPISSPQLPKYLTVSALWYDLIGKNNPEFKNLSEPEMKEQLLKMDLNLAKEYPNLFTKEDFEQFAEFNPIMGSGELPFELDVSGEETGKIPAEVIDPNKKVISIPSEGKKTSRKIDRLLK